MIRVRRLDDISDLPDTLVDLLEAHFFTSPGFASLWRFAGGRPVYWTAEKDGQPAAVLPGVEFGRGPMVRFQSMPDGCYTRAVSVDETDHSGNVKTIIQAVLEHGYAKTFITDFSEEMPIICGFESLESETLLVDITAPDWQPPDSNLRSEIRKAAREGVQIARFNQDKHMGLFLELMLQTETRHGREPRYGQSFFAALADLAARDDRVIWYFVEHEGNPVSSHINFVLNSSVINWQVYFDKQFSFLKANQAMLFQLAGRARESGATTINLGQSPPGAVSLSTYKKKWGGRVHRYRTLMSRRGLGRLL